MAPAQKDRMVCGIDVGMTKVCALIGEVSRDDSVHIIGVGVAPSRGLRKGVVVNIDEAVESIGAAVARAERVSVFKIVSGYIGIAGGHITSLNNRGVVAVSNDDRSIGEDDVLRAIEAARVINIPSNREIIHSIPRHFIVDGQEGVRNPVGMLGYRLDVDAHIVTCAVTAMQNLVKCVHKLGIDVDEVVLESLASSEATLTEEEKEMGVLLADIGGGTTALSIFIEGSVWHTNVLPVGGNHVTNDLAVGLRSPFAVAEEVKVLHGHALSRTVDPGDEVEITTFGQTEKESTSRQQVCGIIEARMQEIFEIIQNEIKRSGYEGLLPAGVVLTGGASELAGAAELAREMLQVPVRVGVPFGIRGLVDSINSPAFATSVGLLLWGARYGNSLGTPQPINARAGSGKISRRDEAPLDAFGRLRSWLKAFLP
jgi:cell division protein FtsA